MLTFVTLLSITAAAGAAPARSAVAAGAQQEASAPAAQPPNTEAEEIRRLIAVGQTVLITNDQGRQVEGKIRALSADLLTIASRRDSSDMPYTSIVRIDRPRDGLGNGALWGFGIGAGFGLAGVIDEEVRECENVGFFSCGDPQPAAYVVFPLITGGIGAVIGLGIDGLIRREPNIYRRGATERPRVVPIVGRGVTGAAVALSW